MSTDHRYVFYNQGYSSIWLYSVAQVVSVWPLGAISVGSYILLTYPHHCVCVCVRKREREREFPYVVSLQDTLGSSYIFPTLVL